MHVLPNGGHVLECMLCRDCNNILGANLNRRRVTQTLTPADSKTRTQAESRVCRRRGGRRPGARRTVIASVGVPERRHGDATAEPGRGPGPGPRAGVAGTIAPQLETVTGGPGFQLDSVAALTRN
jgi:hypothetical protein